MSPRTLLCPLAAAYLAAPACADSRFVMVTDRFGQRVMLFSGTDGALVNDLFIDFMTTGGPIGYPVEPIQVDTEIWVSSIFNGIRRFSADGQTSLGGFGATLLNYTLGFEVVDGVAYVPVTEGVQAGTVFVFNRSGILINSFFVGGRTYDILRRGNELLLHHSGPSGTSILRYTFAGMPIGTFTCPGCQAPSAPGQLTHLPDGGILAAGQGAAGGLYRYTVAGAFAAMYPPVPHGIATLDNGMIFCSFRKGAGSAGTYDLGTGVYTPLAFGLDSFGAGVLIIPTTCYPNCDGSTTEPLLTVADFACFLNRFAAGDSYANCDNSTLAPTLNIQDFTCFINRFAAGCS